MTLDNTISPGQGGHITDHEQLADQINMLEAAFSASDRLAVGSGAALFAGLSAGAAGQVLTAGPVRWATPQSIGTTITPSGGDDQAMIVNALAGNDIVFALPGAYTHATGFVVPAGKQLISEAPDKAIFNYTGTGRGVTLRGRMSRLANIKIRTSNAAATVKAVTIDAPTTDTLFWRMDGVTVSADTEVPGQVGVYFDNTASTAIFWGKAPSCLIENYGTAVDFSGNDPTFGCNANSFPDLQIHNAGTGINFANTYANQFPGVSIDLFDFGVVAQSGAIRNRVDGRMEGGNGSTGGPTAGSKGYDLQSGSQENVLEMDDNTTVPSGDGGLGNLKIITGIGQPKAWESPAMDLCSFPPYFADTSGTIPTAANSGQFCRIPWIRRSMNLTGAKIVVVVQSGNVAVGLYSLDGAQFNRRATTGSIACSVPGLQVLPFTAGFIVDPRKQYYALLTADNITASFLAKSIYDQASLDITGPNVQGRPFYATTAGGMFVPPATVTLASLTPTGGTTDSKVLFVAVT